MKMKKILLLCLSTLLAAMLAAFALVACSGGEDPYGFDAQRQNQSLVEPLVPDEGVSIDGSAEESFWAEAGVLEFTEPQYDINVHVRAYIGESGLYIYAERDDTSVYYSDEKQFFENDSMEFMIDPRPALSASPEEFNKVGARVRPDMLQVRVAANGTYSTWIGRRIGDSDYQWGFFWLPILTGAKVNGELNTPNAAQGFSVEVFVPWSALLLEEKPSEIGLMPASVYAHSFMHPTRTWYAITGMNIDSPATYARLTENGFTVDPRNIESVNAVDADASKTAWQAQDAVTFYEANEANLGRDERASFKAYLGEDGVYVLAQVYDKVTTRYNFVIWDNDGIEFYIDAENQGGSYEEGVRRDGFYRFAIDVDGKYQAERGVTEYVSCVPTYAEVKTAVKTETFAETGTYGYTSLTTYEVFIPYKTIGLESAPDTIGMSFAVKTPNEEVYLADRHLNYTAVMEAGSWLWLRNHYVVTPDTFYHVNGNGLIDADPFHGLGEQEAAVWQDYGEIAAEAQSPDPAYYNYQAYAKDDGIWVKVQQTVDTVKLALVGEEAANAAAESRDYLTHVDVNIWNNNFGNGAASTGSSTYFVLYPNTDYYCASSRNLTRTAYSVQVTDRGEGAEGGRYLIEYKLYLQFDNSDGDPTYVDVKSYTPGFDGYTAGANREGTNSRGVLFRAHPIEMRSVDENGIVPEVVEGNFLYRLQADGTYAVGAAPAADISGALTLPAEYSGKAVTAVLAGGFENQNGITDLTIPSSVRNIEQNAFRNCVGLTSVEFRVNGANGVENIGTNAFNITAEGEDFLTSVTMPSTLRTIGEYVFQGRDQLSSIILNEGLTTIGNSAFMGLSLYGGSEPSGLKSLTIPSTVTTIGRAAFMNNTALATIVFERTESFTIGGKAFGNLPALTSITFRSAAVPEGIVNANETVFTNNAGSPTASDTIIWVPEGAVEAYKTSVAFASRADYIYAEGTSLTQFSFTLNAEENGYIVAKGEEAFSGAVELPDEYRGLPVVAIAEFGFEGCTGITELIVPSSIETIGRAAFRNCTGLASVEFRVNGANGVRTIGNNAFDVTSAGNDFLLSVAMPSTLRTIGEYVFQGRDKLSSIILNEGLTTIGNSAFMGLSLYGGSEPSGLKSLTIPSTVTTIGRAAFMNNTALATIVFERTESFTICGKAFGNLPALTSITFRSAAVPTDASNANESVFTNNAGTPTATNALIYVPEGAVDLYKTWIAGFEEASGNNNVLAMTQARANFVVAEGASLSEGLFRFTALLGEDEQPVGYAVAAAEGASLPAILTIPGTYEDLPVTQIAASGFSNQTGVRVLVIPDGIEVIGANAFSGCTGISALELPGSVKTLGNGAFQYCSGLTSVDLGSVERIENNAFNLRDNTPNSLTTITLPSTLRFLGEYVFLARTALAEIVIEEGIAEISAYAFRATSQGNAAGNGLERIVFPSTVTTVGRAALYANDGLREVVFLSENLAAVGDIALGNCPALESVTFHAATPPTVTGTNPNVLFNLPSGGTTPADVAIYVPADAVEAYKADVVFADRAAYVQAISATV